VIEAYLGEPVASRLAPPQAGSLQESESRNLEVCYGVISALQDVSVDDRDGEIVTLIGANGAGKTTLLRTISGCSNPQRGHAWLATGPLRCSLRPTRSSAWAFTRPRRRQSLPQPAVRENLLLGAYQRTQGELRRTSSVLRQFPSSQSARAAGRDAQRRRAADARDRAGADGAAEAAAARRAVAGLAPLVVRKIFQIIRRSTRRDDDLLVEQNAHMALGVAHRAYVLQSGA
jgi:branched-chain amino acid transport system ATP-binding protein